MTTVRTVYKGDMLFENKAGNQSIITDVTPNMGGRDRAPTPPDLLVVSIGSCVAAFVAHYCQQNGIDTRDLTVETTFEKAEHPRRLKDLKVQVKLPHAECGDREDGIRRVAEHCTVHETIANTKSVPIDILDRRHLEEAALA